LTGLKPPDPITVRRARIISYNIFNGFFWSSTATAGFAADTAVIRGEAFLYDARDSDRIEKRHGAKVRMSRNFGASQTRKDTQGDAR
jgi:hypothetical protein